MPYPRKTRSASTLTSGSSTPVPTTVSAVGVSYLWRARGAADRESLAGVGASTRRSSPAGSTSRRRRPASRPSSLNSRRRCSSLRDSRHGSTARALRAASSARNFTSARIARSVIAVSFGAVSPWRRHRSRRSALARSTAPARQAVRPRRASEAPSACTTCASFRVLPDELQRPRPCLLRGLHVGAVAVRPARAGSRGRRRRRRATRRLLPAPSSPRRSAPPWT